MKDKFTIYLTVILVVVSVIFIYCLYLFATGTAGWLSQIEDPTERGLAYVATAIVLHSFLGRNQIDVKVDGEKP